MHTLGCHEFYDHGLFAHGTGSHHHQRCKRTNLDGSGEIGLNFSAGACDSIARHVDRACAWHIAGSHVSIVHFKGKGKPWKHNLKPCLGVRDGPYQLARMQGAERVVGNPTHSAGSSRRQPWVRTPIQANDSLYWDEDAMHGVGVCRTRSRPSAVVRFASDERVPQICCKSEYLQRAEWFAMARMAGLEPPTATW